MKKANEQTIKNAFARLMADKDEIIRRGMYSLLEEAVKFALEIHDESHQTHIEIGDTYGWALIHNGNIEEISVVSTPQNEGRATEQLRKKARWINKRGWVGIVMAGLEPANYFSVTYESNLLYYTFLDIKQNFFQYFTAI
jgi:hypothetical protein